MHLVLDRPAATEASTLPDRLTFKSAESGVAGGMLDVDETKGIVTAVVSVTGVVDEVDDIILPGAYTETLAKRRPKVVWAHSWEHPIGKVLYIEELMPGDKRLPATQRDGSPWPAEAGALVASMQFMLGTKEGRDAFEVVKFYSESGECEYSIGYMVPPGRSSKNREGTRLIKMMELYELSVVLFGAHTMTGTLSIKAALAGRSEAKSAETFEPPKGVQSNAQRGLDLRKANGGKGGTAVGVARARDLARGAALPLATVKRMASFFARHEGDKSADGWGSTSNPSPGYVAWLLWGGDAGKTWADGIVKRQEGKSALGGVDFAAMKGLASPAMSVRAGTGEKAAPPFVKKDDDEGLTPEDEATETPESPEPEEPAETPVDHSDGIMVAVYPDPAAADAIANHISGPDNTEPREQLHVTLGYLGKVGEMQTNEQDIYDLLVAAVDGQPALNGEIGGIGQFPAGDNGVPTWAPVDVAGLSLLREQVVAALGDMVYTDHGFTPHMTLGYDIGLIEPVPATPVSFTAVSLVYGNSRRDISLGAPVSDAAEGKSARGKAAAYTPALDRKATSYDPAFDRPAVEVKAEGGADRNAGGAEELRRYWTEGEGAVKIGWGTPGDFTRCVKLLDEHMPGRAEGYCANRHKEATGMWPGDRDNKGLISVSLTASDGTSEVKSYPMLPGSYEERQQALTAAIATQYEDDVDDHGNPVYWCSIQSTWDHSVLYAVSNMRLIGDQTDYFIADYEWRGDYAVLGESTPVELAIVPVPVGDDEDEDWGVADDMPIAEDMLGLALTIKTAAGLVTEGKAGRVLSGSNERALRTAVEHLLAVLAAAGLNIDSDVLPDKPVGGGNSPGGAETRRQVDPRTDVTTTSPTPEGKGLAGVVQAEDNGDGTVTLDTKSLVDLDALLADLDG